MGLWDIFKQPTPNQTSNNLGSIYSKINNDLPQSTESEKIIIACTAGLMARVAYVDFHLDPQEFKSMKTTLIKLTGLSENQAQIIVNIASDEIKELAGLDNHIYAHRLHELMNEQERYSILEALFYIAGSDGSVEEIESEEIRIITKGLGLTSKHYLSARATVWQKIKALNL